MQNKKIVLVGPSPSDDPVQHPGGQLTAAMGIAQYAYEQGYDFEVINTLVVSFPPPPFRKKLMAGLRRLCSLLKKLSSGEVSAVILFVGARFSFYERIALSALARLYGERTLFCIRDGNFVNWARSSRLHYWLVSCLLRIPDRIVVQGTRFRDSLVEIGVPKEMLVIVRNWRIDSFPIRAQPKTVPVVSSLRLVFVGWLVKEKGVYEILDVFIDLQSRYQVTLDIVGGGTLENELRQRVADLKLGGIHIHGWLTHSEILDLLDRSHVFILTTYFEGFPNALLEAMARGLPSVCSDVGAISDSIENGVNGFLVPPKDRLSLYRAIENYIEKPQLIFEHSRATLAVVDRLHNREKNLANLFSLIG